MDFVGKAPSSDDYDKKMGFVGDYICAICDDGGELICCEGICGRWFHPSSDTGKDSSCVTVDLRGDYKAMTFQCNNCEFKKHQCFICGKLESSDPSSADDPPKVFQCNIQNCGHFYHHECLSKYYPSTNLPNFECPVHECLSCKNKEGKVTRKGTKPEGSEMCLVVCRRCPVAYHRKCLPREILDTADGEVSRVWEIENRLFFYCKNHKMVEDLRSPKRDHMKIPFDLNLSFPGQTETPQLDAN